MLSTTLGQLLVNEALPPGLRDYDRVLDKTSLGSLFQKVAEEYPDQYRDIAKKVMDVGRDASYSTGGQSFGLRHLRRSRAAQVHLTQLQQKLNRVILDPKLSDEIDSKTGYSEREKVINKLVGDVRDVIEKDVFDESVAEGNPLAHQVKSGAKGSKSNILSLRGGDLAYADNDDRQIPMPILRSYGQGLSPAEYYFGSFGARKGLFDVKKGVQDTGAFAKQIQRAAHRLIVSARDSDQPYDGNIRGLPVDTDDIDNAGALLAHDTGPYKRNEVLTPSKLTHLKSLGHDKIVVRSPMVGGAPDGGLYANDVGVRERGIISPIGESLGLTAASALGEPLSQAGLSSKHCLSYVTEIRMADYSIKRICEIEPGDFVFGSDQEGNIRPVKVLNVFDNGMRDCYLTEFNAGRARKDTIELISTLDHKILSKTTHWHPTHQVPEIGVFPVGKKALSFGARMVRTVNVPSEGINEPYALLLGLLLGDGCYVKSVGGIHLSCFDPSLIEDIKPYLATLGLRIKLCAGQKGYYRISQLKDTIRQDPNTGRTLPGSRNPIKRKLEELGMYGLYAHEKKLPPGVWQWSQESVAQLLAGLFVTEIGRAHV